MNASSVPHLGHLPGGLQLLSVFAAESERNHRTLRRREDRRQRLDRDARNERGSEEIPIRLDRQHSENLPQRLEFLGREALAQSGFKHVLDTRELTNLVTATPQLSGIELKDSASQ